MGLADGWTDATFPAGLRVHVAEFNQRAYLTNGWTRMRRWQGLWARRTDWSGVNEYQEVPYAGIEGPSQEEGSWAPAPSETAAAGTGWSVGPHRFQYRYQDESTGWVSNASAFADYTVTAASKKLTFPVGPAGSAATHIIHSTDFKVTHIVIEATLARGSQFYLVGTFPIRASVGGLISEIVAEISDAALVNSPIDWELTGHGLPPVKRYALAHRDRLWLYGNVIYTRGTASCVQNNTTVQGTNTEWTEDALGTAADPPIIGRRFFRSLGGSEYYPIAARVNNGELTLGLAAGFTASGFTYEIVSANDRIYFSLEGMPESFAPTNFLTPPVGGYGGAVSAVVGLDQGLLIYTARGCWRYSYGTDPLAGTYYPTPGERGALSPRVVVSHGGRVFALDHQGAWVYSGGLPVDLSADISDFLAGLDWSYSDKWHAVYLHEARAIVWTVTKSGQTEPASYMALFMREGEQPGWSFGDLTVARTESHLGRLTDALALVPVGGDENGYVWWLDKGVSEGADGYSHRTVAAGSTTSLIEVGSGVLPSDGSLRGVTVTRVSTGGTLETRVISAHDTDSISLMTAFSGVPATGSTIWLGRIPARLMTKAWYGARDGKIRFKNLRIYFTPLSATRYLQVRLYSQHGGSALTWATFWAGASTEPYPGLIFPGRDTRFPSTDWLVDLSYAEGMVEIPIGPQASWMLEVELILQDPETALELWRIELDGVEERSPEN